MDEFIERVKAQGLPSFENIRRVAVDIHNNWSEEKQNNLWAELNHGVKILQQEEELCQYLYSFGIMHKAKLYEAFNSIKSYLNDIQLRKVEIYDWGCGQGLATICFLDYLREHKLSYNIKRVTLVEPSAIAIKRAQQLIELYNIFGAKPFEIRPICSKFDELTLEQIKECDGALKIHLFSNILDVVKFNMARFIQISQHAFSGDNLYLCVSPIYQSSSRLDMFKEAIAPDHVYAALDRESGLKKYTITMRVFSKHFDAQQTENIKLIQQRIDNFTHHLQLSAGYVLDEVEEQLKLLATDGNEENKTGQAQVLLRLLSNFDLRSNKNVIDTNEQIDAKWAVMSNIISRGWPTLAPIHLQNIFAKELHTALKPQLTDTTLCYKANAEVLQPEELFEALHVIDPRFKLDQYNGDMLESDFERGFVNQHFNHQSTEYLLQLLEPQRALSSIIKLHACEDERVDFALEIPNNKSEGQHTGCIIEIDGAPYHADATTKEHDAWRDQMEQAEGWTTCRIKQLDDEPFLKYWQNEPNVCTYLRTLKKNYLKKIKGEWAIHLQAALTPIAVARIQRAIIQAVLCNHLSTSAKQWHILVIERDVPCAQIALYELKDMFQHLCALEGVACQWPEVELEVMSTPEFAQSPLHLGIKPQLSVDKSNHFDLIIDHAILLRDHIDALPIPQDTSVCYIIRSAHYQKQNPHIIVAPCIKYQPLVTKDNEGNYVDIAAKKTLLTYFLQLIFRKREFRQGQLPILSRALALKSTIGLLPTGGGKSLTYQLAAFMQPGVTLVVDPLVSLMTDQYNGMREAHFDNIAFISSLQSMKEKNQVLGRMEQGELQMVFLSPERFMMEDFRKTLTTMANVHHVYFTYGVIDEVHCISEWGHDFRTSYLHLGRNMMRFMQCLQPYNAQNKKERSIPVLGLTATASFDVLADVERELTLNNVLTLDTEAIVRPEETKRQELNYHIERVKANFPKSANNEMLINNDWDIRQNVSIAKRNQLLRLLQTIPNDLSAINKFHSSLVTPSWPQDGFYKPNENYCYERAGIIFCPHRTGWYGVKSKENDNFYNETKVIPGITNALLTNPDYHIGSFIGGDKPEADMESFKRNRLNVMVATKAFGMGIDKPNVRFTVNFNHPSSIESFVQESGRAGRDKKNAIGYLLYEDTFYLHLTEEHINDIANFMQEKNIPTWLWYNKGHYIFKEHFKEWVLSFTNNFDLANKLFAFCEDKNFFENEDKNVCLYFHHLSFKGKEKELSMLNELLYGIKEPPYTHLKELQEKLREATENDSLFLKLKNAKNGFGITVVNNDGEQYGFVYVHDNMPFYKYATADKATCQFVMNHLVILLNQLGENRSGEYLMKTADIEQTDKVEQSIFKALDSTPSNEAYVTLSWKNMLAEDTEKYEQLLWDAVTKIASNEGWYMPMSHIKLTQCDTYNAMLKKIAESSRDPNWLLWHQHTDKYRELYRIYDESRDKSDTDKAIFRLTCIGLVDDVTIDYTKEFYKLKVCKLSDEEYYDNMFKYFCKYYSEHVAHQKVDGIRQCPQERVVDKCLYYLVGFIYDSLEKKRLRAIDDMRNMCDEAIQIAADNTEKAKIESSEWMKEYIHLYFNSKYARTGYMVDNVPCSLADDMEDKKSYQGFNLVKKYIDVALVKDTTGTQNDNVKHLYGAVLLLLRSYTDSAPLLLLQCFCIHFLGIKNNKNLIREAQNAYIQGFMKIWKDEQDDKVVLDYINFFNQQIEQNFRTENESISDWILNEGTNQLSVQIHLAWVRKFKLHYCKNLTL